MKKKSCQCFRGGSIVGTARFDFVKSINEGTLYHAFVAVFAVEYYRVFIGVLSLLCMGLQSFNEVLQW